jgi:hypothetical protein
MPLPEQIRLIFAEVFRAQFFRRPIEVSGEIFDHAQVRSRGTLRVIPTLEFLEHQLA